MKVIDKIGPDGCVYVINVDINNIGASASDVDGEYNLRAVFNHKGYKEIGDSLKDSELSEGAQCFWVRQIYTEDGEFIYEHKDNFSVRRNILITYSHLLRQNRYEVIYNSAQLQDKHQEEYKESMRLLLEGLMQDSDYLTRKMEHYEIIKDWDML